MAWQLVRPFDKPLCAEYDPELWFPELPPHHSVISPKSQEQVGNGVLALEICARCPLIDKCTEDTFSSPDSIMYGISAGLTPIEKRDMIGASYTDLAPNLWINIRKQATYKGITPPPQPKREKPRPLYKLIEKNGEPSDVKRNVE